MDEISQTCMIESEELRSLKNISHKFSFLSLLTQVTYEQISLLIKEGEREEGLRRRVRRGRKREERISQILSALPVIRASFIYFAC